MNRFESVTKPLMWFMTLLLVAFVAGCGGGGGGGRDPILGEGGVGEAVLPPTVTAVAPLNNATGVPVNLTIITAAFSEPMAPLTGGASFTVTCAAPCASPIGTVALDATNRIATFTSAAPLAPLTLYTATVTGAKSLATGLALASPYVWHFTTGVTPDTTRPRVTLTVPATTIPGPTAGVPTNTAIIADFTEEMAATSINATSFTVTCAAPCVSPAGTVSYAVGSQTAVFKPAAVLAAGTTYTATITTAATDLALNALAGNQAPLPAASNYVWTFTTAAAPVAPGNITVQSTNPVSNGDGVVTNASVNAVFTRPSGFRMDPATITPSTFTVTEDTPALTPVTAASVILGPLGRTATFTPLQSLGTCVTYTAKIKGGANGVKDLAIPANTMASDYTWRFTTGPCGVAPPPVPLAIDLGVAAPFAVLANAPGASISAAGATTVNGNMGTTQLLATITGFPTPPGPGILNGSMYGSDTPVPNNNVSALANAALNTAYLAGQTLGGTAPPANIFANGTDLGTKSPLAPGIYRAAATSLAINTPLVLDAGGNCAASWIIYTGSTLITGGTGSVTLAGNCENPKNIWWVVGSSATLGATAPFIGNILANTSITVSGVPVTVTGRLLAGAVAGTGAVSFTGVGPHTVTLP